MTESPGDQEGQEKQAGEEYKELLHPSLIGSQGRKRVRLHPHCPIGRKFRDFFAATNQALISHARE